MTNSIFGYENRFRDEAVVITASSDPVAAPKENAYDWRLEDFWQPAAATQNWIEFDFTSAKAFDFIGFYSSDFYTFTGAELEVVHGAATNPSTVAFAQNITTRGPKLIQFTSASARFWRIRLNTTGAETPKLQMLAGGDELELLRGLRPGFMPPALGNTNRAVTNVSENGLFLGRSVEVSPVDFKINTTALSPSWVRANWPALLAHIEKLPFFYLPEPDAHPDEAVIAWTRGIIRPPVYSRSNFLSLTLNASAHI